MRSIQTQQLNTIPKNSQQSFKIVETFKDRSRTPETSYKERRTKFAALPVDDVGQ